MNNPPGKLCPRCQTLTGLAAPSCLACGHVYRTHFTPPDPAPPTQMYRGTESPAAPLYPVQPRPASQYPVQTQQGAPQGHFPQYSPGYAPPPVNVLVSTPVTVNNTGGWWMALCVLLFTTPVGWVLLGGIALAFLLCFALAVQGLPMIVAGIIALLIGVRRGPWETDSRRTLAVVGILGVGFLLNIVYWWILFGRPSASDVPVAAPANIAIASNISSDNGSFSNTSAANIGGRVKAGMTLSDVIDIAGGFGGTSGGWPGKTLFMSYHCPDGTAVIRLEYGGSVPVPGQDASVTWPIWTVDAVQTLPKYATSYPSRTTQTVPSRPMQRAGGSFYPMAGFDYPADLTHPAGSMNHETVPPSSAFTPAPSDSQSAPSAYIMRTKAGGGPPPGLSRFRNGGAPGQGGFGR